MLLYKKNNYIRRRNKDPLDYQDDFYIVLDWTKPLWSDWQLRSPKPSYSTNVLLVGKG